MARTTTTTTTTNPATCDCCGSKRRVLRQGQFTVAGRLFDGWICKTCATCDQCGEPIWFDDNGQPNCNGETCQAFNGAEVTK